MPHIQVKIVGKTEEEKERLAAAITRAVMDEIQADEANISVAIIDVEKSDWVEKVYKPEILAHQDAIYKKPGYDPFA